MKIAAKHNLFVVEDCALAIGTKFKGVHVGLLGDVGTFSFYPVKHMTTAEGGMLITKHEEIANKIYITENFNLFVFLEVASLTAYALVATGSPLRGNVSSFRYLLIGTVGASFYLLGVGYLYAATGTLNMTDMAARLPDVMASRSVSTTCGHSSGTSPSASVSPASGKAVPNSSIRCATASARALDSDRI